MKRSAYTIAFTVIVCGISALVVTGAKSAWHEQYLYNLRHERLVNVLAALGIVPDPAGVSRQRARALYESRIRPVEHKRVELYKAVDDAGETTGWAVVWTGQGVWGEMQGVLALEPDRRTVRALRIFKLEETPGKGSRVAEAEFLDQFAGKTIAPAGRAPGLRVVGMRGKGQTLGEHEVDAVSGASKSSRAVVAVLNRAIGEFLAGRQLEPVQLPQPDVLAVGSVNIPPASSARPPSRRPNKPVMLPPGTRNVALGRPVTASDEMPLVGSLEMVTDGVIAAEEGSFVEVAGDLVAGGPAWVQVDLGRTYEVHLVRLWHDYAHPAIYRDVAIAVSDDPTFPDPTVVYLNDADGSLDLGEATDPEYVETFQGLLVRARDASGRYVRVYTGAAHDNPMPMARFVELEVYGVEPD